MEEKCFGDLEASAETTALRLKKGAALTCWLSVTTRYLLDFGKVFSILLAPLLNYVISYSDLRDLGLEDYQ